MTESWYSDEPTIIDTAIEKLGYEKTVKILDKIAKQVKAEVGVRIIDTVGHGGFIKTPGVYKGSETIREPGFEYRFYSNIKWNPSPEELQTETVSRQLDALHNTMNPKPTASPSSYTVDITPFSPL